jgi:hypothetical protein
MHGPHSSTIHSNISIIFGKLARFAVCQSICLHRCHGILFGLFRAFDLKNCTSAEGNAATASGDGGGARFSSLVAEVAAEAAAAAAAENDRVAGVAPAVGRLIEDPSHIPPARLYPCCSWMQWHSEQGAGPAVASQPASRPRFGQLGLGCGNSSFGDGCGSDATGGGARAT